MDELAQCYNVLPQLDINNTIDHRPEGDEKWFLENEKTVTQFCRKLAAERPIKDIRDEYNYPKKKGIFFFQAKDGIRDSSVTGVQTCALPICMAPRKKSRTLPATPQCSGADRQRLLAFRPCGVAGSVLDFLRGAILGMNGMTAEARPASNATESCWGRGEST